ncbi:putative AraC-family transcriptional regulator [Plesiocystis pacifica SIR-1]|uniref:Putative AraC-family transcriptional regulator n=1 Tax=Plesiocystis pacifica SIR-1 TaxID=391625 RepID=A6GJ55_9BACT|nr:helix-turn-helix domain-containing protein [Plesiocystis pacifica]EDM74093.1 putative AraC-family transcriptional regulator [Plesiocystis pacifica SIR-1]
MRRVAVVAFDGVVLGDLGIPCEVFGRAGYELRVCSPGAQVRGRHLALSPAYRLASLRWADTVVVPGVEDLDQPLPPALLRALVAAAERGARVASICTGAFVLAAAGLLDGRRATTHWQAAAELERRFPAITVEPEVLHVDGGDGRYSSAGAAAAFDLCLHLIRLDRGAEAAARVARACVMPLERAGGQAQFIDHRPPRVGDGSLAQLLAWIEGDLTRDLSLEALARAAGTSPRTLSRRFREQTGTTPARWVNQARVRRAQRLLETTGLSVEQVASEAGFGSAAVLRARFRDHAGTTPLAYRRAFRAPCRAEAPKSTKAKKPLGGQGRDGAGCAVRTGSCPER